MRSQTRFVLFGGFISLLLGTEAFGISAADYPSIQEAIDAHPGQMIEIPGGMHEISQKLRIGSSGGGLYGHGTLVQTNPDEPILEIEHADAVRIEGIALTRKEGFQECSAPAIFCYDSSRVRLDGLTLAENWGGQASIVIRESTECSVTECEIRNYKKITIDDRTGSPELYGYAFKAIDGHGIVVDRSIGTVIRDNRVIEERILPDRKTQQEFGLGNLTEGKNPSVEGKLAKSVFQRGSVDNWHQGSAILVTGPTGSSDTMIRGNFIRNAGQGIDLHCDRVICTDNRIREAMIGIKATHGSRHLLIAENLVTHVDLWGILLNPGAGSFVADETREENVDGGTIIANNIISDFGLGPNYWNWGGKSEEGGNSYAIALYGGQLEDNPPLSDVVVQGNLVYNSSRLDANGKAMDAKYRYAVFFGSWNGPVEKDSTCPMNILFDGNLFQPGKQGVSNLPFDRFIPDSSGPEGGH